MKRGFKSHSERLTEKIRGSMGLRLIDPLDPFKLAKSLDVIVWYPEDIDGFDKQSCKRLATTHKSIWSAVTLCMAGAHLVILNSAHSANRRASSLTHELAHVISGHKPSTIELSADGDLLQNEYDKDQEEEAHWLAGALLLPRPALMHILWTDADLTNAARRYGVSKQLLDWRMNATGARKQASRTRR